MTAPKVFVSHAGEDKDRFVIGFASRLRAKGVDAWLDKWEMRPGDKLLDKIFDEGIRNARAVIVVISKNSINKAWCKTHLDFLQDFCKTAVKRCRVLWSKKACNGKPNLRLESLN